MQLVPSIQGFGRAHLNFISLAFGWARLATLGTRSPLFSLSPHLPFSAGTVLLRVSTPLSSEFVSTSDYASVPQHLYHFSLINNWVTLTGKPSHD